MAGGKPAKCVPILAIIFAALAAIFMAAAAGTPWVRAKWTCSSFGAAPEIKVRFYGTKACSDTPSGNECNSWSEIKDSAKQLGIDEGEIDDSKFKGATALAALATIILLVSGGLTVATLISSNPTPMKVGGGIALFALLFGLVAPVLPLTSKIYKDYIDLIAAATCIRLGSIGYSGEKSIDVAAGLSFAGVGLLVLPVIALMLCFDCCCKCCKDQTPPKTQQPAAAAVVIGSPLTPGYGQPQPGYPPQQHSYPPQPVYGQPQPGPQPTV